MSESQISVDNQTYPLQQPFMVIATQNPAEYHGTFPLPESQSTDSSCDFASAIRLRMRKESAGSPQLLHPADEIQPVLSAQHIVDLQAQAEKGRMEDSLMDYLLAIVLATRHNELLSLGVSARGALALCRAAKALALVRDRAYCLPKTSKSSAPTVLSHRVMLSRSQGMRTNTSNIRNRSFKTFLRQSGSRVTTVRGRTPASREMSQ
ncbi:MAG: MoxR family ATPase [Nitrospira sp.]|nr:MoxR family ATPase [Nitrospira sp.]